MYIYGTGVKTSLSDEWSSSLMTVGRTLTLMEKDNDKAFPPLNDRKTVIWVRKKTLLIKLQLRKSFNFVSILLILIQRLSALIN